MRSVLVALAILVLVPASVVHAADMPIYVTPHYDSNGPVVRAGEFSDGLATTDPAVLASTLAEMKGSWPTLQVAPMYIAAIRSYDLGDRDGAVYWFYAAQHRARVFHDGLDPEKLGPIGSPAFELDAAHGAFFQLAGQFINGYAFCDLAALKRTLAQVVSDSEATPDLTKAYPDLTFQDAARLNEISAETSAGLRGFIDSLDAEYPAIKAKRDASGATKRFCGADAP